VYVNNILLEGRCLHILIPWEGVFVMASAGSHCNTNAI